MLLGVDGGETDALFHMPGAKPLQRLEEVVGEGDGAVGRRVRVGSLPWLGEKDHVAFLPETRGVPEVETRMVDDTQNAEHIGREV